MSEWKMFIVWQIISDFTNSLSVVTFRIFVFWVYKQSIVIAMPGNCWKLVSKSIFSVILLWLFSPSDSKSDPFKEIFSLGRWIYHTGQIRWVRWMLTWNYLRKNSLFFCLAKNVSFLKKMCYLKYSKTLESFVDDFGGTNLYCITRLI